MHACCVAGCRNEGKHVFPKDINLRKQWEVATRHICIKKQTKVCWSHFKPEDYIIEGKYSGLRNSNKVLRKGVVPSIFSWTKASSKMKAKKKRNKRSNTTCDVHLKNAEFEHETSTLHNEDCKQETSILQNVAGEQETSTTDNAEYQQETSTFQNVIIKQETLTLENANCKQEPFWEVYLENEDFEQKTSKLSETNTLEPKHTINSGMCSIGTQKFHQPFSVEYFRNKDRAITFYTGFESFEKFKFVFTTLCPDAYTIRCYREHILHLSSEDQFLLTTMKLYRNNDDYELGLFFNISKKTVYRILYTWIDFMHQKWTMLNLCPNEEIVNLQKIKLTKNYEFLNVPLNSAYATLEPKLYFVCQVMSNFTQNVQ